MTQKVRFEQKIFLICYFYKKSLFTTAEIHLLFIYLKVSWVGYLQEHLSPKTKVKYLIIICCGSSAGGPDFSMK